MKKLIKIISNIPCYLKANNEVFFVESSIFLEVIDENEIFFNATPSQSCEYFPINYVLKSKLQSHNNIRITKYKNNIKLEFMFTSANKIKSFKKDNLEISYYNGYYLNKNNKSCFLSNFTHNYFKLDIEKLNENYFLIKGFYKLRENEEQNLYNQKIDIAIYDDKIQAIIHQDSCNKIEIEANILKVISLMFDQNKQALICEFYVNENSFTKKDFYSSYTKQKPSRLNKKYQINQAFFECILSHNYNLLASYLTDDLKGKINDKNLHLMFNNFLKVDTEFLTNLDEVNLITKVSNNIYDSTTYKIEYIQNKISNIISI